MNIQTEHLADHTARLTVEVDPNRLEQAKQTVIRKVAKSVQIPGFRKGKAPQNMVLRYVGEARILEDAIDDLGQEIYRETLDSADVKPYGPGALDDVKFEPTLTFVYTVPLQPTVELGDYRGVRAEYTAPEVTDEMVEQALKNLQQQEADSEVSDAPVALGDRVTVDIHSFFVDEDADAETDDEAAEAAEESDEDGDDEHDEHHSDHEGEPFIHEHAAELMLVEGDDEPVGPGFVAAMLGATTGESREFRLTYPSKEEDDTIADEVAGRTVEFFVQVNQVEKVNLPALDDAFAARLTDRFATPEELASVTPAESAADEDAEQEADDDANTDSGFKLTFAQLKERVRESLAEEAKANADQAYADQVLEKMVEGANVAYPEAMIEEQIDSMVQSLDQRLRQQGIPLDMYINITGKSMDDIRNDYRPTAEEMLKRSLVLFEVAMTEKLQVTPADYDAHIDLTMQRLGIDSAEFRKTFENASVRENIYNRLLQDKTFDRIAAIGKGEAPELVVEAEVTAEEAPEAVANADDADAETEE